MPPTPLASPPGNRLLHTLVRGDLQRVLGASETVDLAFAQVLCRAGDRLDHVYFPLRSFISLIMHVDATASLEVGLVGCEGMFGISLALGVESSPVDGVVQGAGSALRIEASAFDILLKRSGSLRRQLDRYVYLQLRHLAQTAACTRFHVVEARLARWLLMTQDRAQSPSFHVTQEFLALMLGVRRVGVTKAASALQQRNLIRYTRGNMMVLDRGGLKAASCSCYQQDCDAYEELFAESPPLAAVSLTTQLLASGL